VLDGGRAVELRWSASTRPGASGAAGVGDFQQPGINQLVEMERGQRAPDPERLGDLVTADRTSAGSQDRAVSRTAYAVGQRGQRRKVRVRFIGGHHAVIVLLTGIGSTRVTGRSAAALRVVGVELSADLCRQACKNVERLRDRRAPNTVENVLADKYDYADTTRPVAVRPVRNAILRSALERIVGGTRGRSLRSPTPTRHTTRCSREQPGAGRFRWRIEMSVRRRHPQCGVRMRRPMLSGLPVIVTARIRSDRVFHLPAPARAHGQIGRSTRHGSTIDLGRPDTHPRRRGVHDGRDQPVRYRVRAALGDGPCR
jgi:hypothetical protein